MATYWVGLKYTNKGLEKLKDSPSRLESTKKICKQSGVEVREFFLLMGGHYDAVMSLQAPNDEAVAKSVLAIDSMGTVTTQTCRAYNEDEFRKFISALP